MLEPQVICEKIEHLFAPSSQKLKGKVVVITAGPTREALDPVRYITNHSSGKMGYALAETCQSQGASVKLISGPVALDCPVGVERINVTSAQDMYDASIKELNNRCDIFIASAAVADYRAKTVNSQKMKKQSDDDLTIALCQNPDIVASVSEHSNRPFVVGFAAETNDVLDYAQKKLAKKNLDMIVANDVSQSGIGFNSDENEVYILTKSDQTKLDQSSKQRIAQGIVDHIVNHLG